MSGVEHWSSCAVHNEPAYPAGPCDCGGIPHDMTAFRAVDACGGTYTAEQEASGYAQGHRDALNAACEAVKKPDALMAELLDRQRSSASPHPLTIVIDWYRSLPPRARAGLSLEQLHTLSKSFSAPTNREEPTDAALTGPELHERGGRWFAYFPGIDLTTPERRQAFRAVLAKASGLADTGEPA